MIIFLTLLFKLIPLYLIIGLGYFAGKHLQAQKETLANILIYTIAPVVVFYGVWKAEINTATLLLPLIFFLICSFMAVLFLHIGKIFWPKDGLKNMLAFTAGSGNTGYFGLPVALILFHEQGFSIAVLIGLGFIIFENSVGVYLLARSEASVRDSLLKLLRLPTIYAFALGLVMHALAIPLEDTIINNLELFKGAYTVLGMMIIGMGLATAQLGSFDRKFISLALLAKFITWPIIVLALIYLDNFTFHLYTYNTTTQGVMLLFSIVPLAANTVSWATKFKLHPEKAAVAVLVSTLIALAYIPFMMIFLVEGFLYMLWKSSV